MKKFNLLLLISALIFVGCNGKSTKTDSSTTSTDSVTKSSVSCVEPSVYVIGNETPKTHSYNDIPIYWKDGVKTVLSGGDATAMAVHNNIVFITGGEYNGEKNLSYYWKNADKIELVHNYDFAISTNIAVSGEDIYIAGEFEYKAGYWKNGKINLLSNGGSRTLATAIAISGNDIYVAGCEYIGSGVKACYWKNGQKHTLKANCLEAYPNTITISGNDVYITGYHSLGMEPPDNPDEEIMVSCYWKNGQITSFTDKTKNTWVESIVVSGDDEYRIGKENNIACVWKNNIKTELESSKSEGGSEAKSILVIGNDIYVAGTEKYDDKTLVCLWKNGKKTVIQEINNDVEIKSILVQ